MAQNIVPKSISSSTGWSNATVGNLSDNSDSTYATVNNATNSIVISSFTKPFNPASGTCRIRVRANKAGGLSSFMDVTLSVTVYEDSTEKGTISTNVTTSFATYSSSTFSVSNYTNLNATVTSTYNSNYYGQVADVWIEVPDPDPYALQTIVPDADISATGWTDAGYARLADGSDSTYGYCSNLTNLLLLSLEEPYIIDPSATATVYWRTVYEIGTGGNITCGIRQGSTVKGEQTKTVTTTTTTHSFSTTIDAFNDLRVSFYANALYLRVYDVWVEVLAGGASKPYFMLWHPF